MFTPRMSLRGETDELMAALASVTPADLARVADVAKSLFGMLRGPGDRPGLRPANVSDDRGDAGHVRAEHSQEGRGTPGAARQPRGCP